MDALPLIVPLAMLVAVGGALAAQRFSKANVVKRAIAGAPRRRIGEVGTGEVVRITGRVQSASAPLVAPISGRKCAYFDAVVEEQIQGGPQEIARESDGHDLLVRDASGVALVSPEGAQIVLTYDVAGHFGVPLSHDELPPAVESLLRRHRIAIEGRRSFGSPTLRWREGVLAEGELIAVVGRGRWEEAHGDGYRGEGNKRLVVEPAGEDPVLITDDRGVVLAPRG